MGGVIQIKTRFLYKCIESRVSWDKNFNISSESDMAKEIPFWKFNITNPNNTCFNNYHTPHLFVYFETSQGLAWLFKEQ